MHRTVVFSSNLSVRKWTQQSEAFINSKLLLTVLRLVFPKAIQNCNFFKSRKSYVLKKSRKDSIEYIFNTDPVLNESAIEK